MENSSLLIPIERNIFTNRTLNMNSIQAIGYDMDYTLIHYDVKRWEQAMYAYLKRKLLGLGWPVESLEYVPEMIIRGLVLDKKLGNIVKPNRFGYVKRAVHGTIPLDFGTMRKVYSRTTVDIREDRWLLLTTLFDIPVACMYSQLVEKLDRDEFPEVMGYADLAERIIGNLDAAYAEGMLKNEILKDPARYVVEDTDISLTLLDQKHAGKKLLLITNSEWEYVKSIMAYTFDPQLQDGMTWRDLFDMVIVSADKPNFFLRNQPAFEVVTEEGLLRPVIGSLGEGCIYVGGHAKLVEEAFGLQGSQIMYIGDHQEIFNPRWGLLTRAGFDKSYLARQLEGYADIYMSRVSNLLYQTPFAYLRSTRSSLPHDGGIIGGPDEANNGLKYGS